MTIKVAWSYLRFSTVEQGQGHSGKRQDTGAEGWCARKGYVLDEARALSDKGRSGFRGANARGKGKLAHFLALVEAGVVEPGHVLIIENLDRMSRQKINASMDIVKKILMAGVDIVTLIPEDWYTKAGLESDPMTWMKLVWYFQRAHDESRMKSERTKANWEEKRAQLKDKKVITATRPFWLDIVQDGEVIPTGRGKLDLSRPMTWRANDKLKIVKLCFQMADEGQGALKISKELVKRKWKFRHADVATQTTIIRLLTDRQVLGEYQAKKLKDEKGVRASVGDVIEGYYPAVIDIDQFQRVQTLVKQRQRGSKVGKGRPSPNLFSGLMYDGRDDGPMYVRQGRKQHWLYSYWALKGKVGSVWIEYPYAKFEDAVLDSCRELSPSMLTPATPAADDVRRLEGELADVLGKVERAQAKLDAAKDEEEEEVYEGRLVRLTKQRKDVEAQLDEARRKVSSQPADQLRQLKSLLAVLKESKDKERTRGMIRSLITSLVKRITVYVQRQGKFRKRCWVWIEYVNGYRRSLYIDPDCVLVTLVDKGGEMKVPAGGGWE